MPVDRRALNAQLQKEKERSAHNKALGKEIEAKEHHIHRLKADAAKVARGTAQRGSRVSMRPQPKGKPKPKTAKRAAGQGGRGDVVAAYKFYDPAYNLTAMPSLMSVGRVTHVPMVCRFDVKVPLSNSQYSYRKMLIMTTSATAVAAAEVDLTEDLSAPTDPTKTFTTVKYHYFINVCPSPAVATGIPAGGNNIPQNVKCGRYSFHMQNCTNMFAKNGNVYVRRLAAPLKLPTFTKNGATFPYLDYHYDWFMERENEIKGDSTTAPYIAEDFIHNMGIVSVPANQSTYANFLPWPQGIQELIPASDVNGANPSMVYAGFLNAVLDPIMTTTVILFDDLPAGNNVTDQIYRCGVFTDQQMRFPSGNLLNNMAKPIPTAGADRLNSMRDLMESTGSRMFDLTTGSGAQLTQARG